MQEMPVEVSPYKRTPTFTQESIPAGLLKAHQTKPSTWGKIIVLRGKLLYRILEPTLEEVHLSPEKFGVVEPSVLHQVQPMGEVSFYVEFHR